MATRHIHYLAIPIRPGEGVPDIQKAHMWDMLRYSRAFPMEELAELTRTGWIVLMQPPLPEYPGGYDEARWASFGFPTVFQAAAPFGVGLPSRLRRAMEQYDAHRFH